MNLWTLAKDRLKQKFKSQFVGMGRKARRDFAKYHLCEAFRSAVAEANGDEDLSRRLHAETKLRLIAMSDEELRELAKLVSSPPEWPVELAYKGIKQAIEEHRQQPVSG